MKYFLESLPHFCISSPYEYKLDSWKIVSILCLLLFDLIHSKLHFF